MRIRSLSLLLILTSVFLASCVGSAFNFDDGDNQGWTAAGLYEDDTLNPIAGYPFSDVPASWHDGVNSPNSPPTGDLLGDGNGSIGVGTGGGPLPAGPMGLWSWHLNSPDLSSRSGWQGSPGVRVDLVGSMATLPTTVQVSAQLLLRVQQPNGTISFFTDGVLHNVPINVLQTAATWQSFTLDTSSMLAGSTVLNVSVRIFGPTAGYDGFFFLDRVSPL